MKIIDDDPIEERTAAAGGAKTPKVSLNNFKMDKILGQGSYAIVKLATNKLNDEQVAIKVYEKFRLSDPRKMKNVRREISILQHMNHPNIIKLHDSFDTNKQIYLIMEYIGKNSLHAFIKSKPNRRIEDAEAKKIFIQICKGISYCHSKSIVHRDLKLENILISDDKTVKLIDFGFSIVSAADKTLNIFCGTPSYMAPEIVSKKNYKGQATDCWALGILLYILLCGAFPFRGYDDRDLFGKIKRGKFEAPSHVSEGARNLLQKILKVNPDERATIDEILMDRWLTS
jgi:MAP/microtubule affinity-regulating kinase